MVRFDPADGSTPTQETVKTGTLATPPQHNPQRPGFRFDGWTLDGQPYDFQTPILQDTTLTAQWSKTTDWRLSPEHGPATGARLTISPPDRQEPCYTSIQSAGNQVVGLTGDGRIHTWTQDHTPKQVPAPAQAPGGFRYLQAAAGSRRQAALGSDQRIYIWDSQQLVPTLLDTGQNAGFTSISMNDNRLLAVDRQGQVHIFQVNQTNSQNPKSTVQETIGLPGQADGFLYCGLRILAVGLIDLEDVDLSLPVHGQEPIIVHADAGEPGVLSGVQERGYELLAVPNVDPLVGSQGGLPAAAGCGLQVAEPAGSLGGGGNLLGCVVLCPGVDAPVAGQAHNLVTCGLDARVTGFLPVGRADGQPGAGGGPVLRAQPPVRGLRPLGCQGRVLQDGGLEVVGLAVKRPSVEPEAGTLRVVLRGGGKRPGLHGLLCGRAAVGRVETHHMCGLTIRFIIWFVRSWFCAVYIVRRR